MEPKTNKTTKMMRKTTDLHIPLKKDGSIDKRYTLPQFCKLDGSKDKRTINTHKKN
jgi:hypothetical protein